MTDYSPTPPPGSEPPPTPGVPHRGVTILVLGILGIVCCGIMGILAWIWGNNDLEEMGAGRMDPAGRDMTNIGRILGMIATALMAIWILWWIVAAVIGGAMFPFRHGFMRPY
jgi:amino acid transporter